MKISATLALKLTVGALVFLSLFVCGWQFHRKDIPSYVRHTIDASLNDERRQLPLIITWSLPKALPHGQVTILGDFLTRWDVVCNSLDDVDPRPEVFTCITTSMTGPHLFAATMTVPSKGKNAAIWYHVNPGRACHPFSQKGDTLGTLTFSVMTKWRERDIAPKKLFKYPSAEGNDMMYCEDCATGLCRFAVKVPEIDMEL